MTQNDLFSQSKFDQWLQDNRKIYDRFVELALQMKRTGRNHYSARAIVHVMRWETELADNDVQFKINNNYTPGLARKAMAEHTELKGFFRCRDSLGRDLPTEKVA